jgi:hypothetical protein
MHVLSLQIYGLQAIEIRRTERSAWNNERAVRETGITLEMALMTFVRAPCWLRIRHLHFLLHLLSRSGRLSSHRSGRSRAQLVNLANITAYVVARIVLVPISGQAKTVRRSCPGMAAG